MKIPLPSEQIQRWNAAVQRINALSLSEFSDLMKTGACPFPCQELAGQPIGMFHCDICGTMVVAGMPHGPMDPPWHPEKSQPAQDFYAAHPELWP